MNEMATKDSPTSPARRGKITREMVEVCARWLGCAHMFQIKDLMRKMARANGHEKLSYRTIAKIVSRAREKRRRDNSLAFPEPGEDAIAWYRKIVLDPNLPLRERIRAQERVDSILGVDAKYGRVQIMGTLESNVDPEMDFPPLPPHPSKALENAADYSTVQDHSCGAPIRQD